MTANTLDDRQRRPLVERGLASLSLDLDNKWAYLKTHGDVRWRSLPSYLEVVTPRILDILRRHGLTTTFFVVGQDAALESHRDVLASIADAGHEIANHSFHHEVWFHLHSEDRIAQEIALAEEHIQQATGRRPVGFRGPAYGISKSTLRVLARRGYRYDASTLPTFIGPLARAYVLFASRLTSEERAQRAALFGGVRDVLRPIRPYYWDVGGERLLEIPVSTMPLLRLPFHFNYVLYLAGTSRRLAQLYFRTALELCRATGVSPSLLLGPLDFLGGEEDADLSWCPAMNLPRQYKLEVLEEVLVMATQQFAFVPLLTLAESVAATHRLAVIRPTFSHQKGITQ
jgi:peptidoglycan-N-acetylglucosamine deacetylase